MSIIMMVKNVKIYLKPLMDFINAFFSTQNTKVILLYGLDGCSAEICDDAFYENLCTEIFNNFKSYDKVNNRTRFEDICN